MSLAQKADLASVNALGLPTQAGEPASARVSAVDFRQVARRSVVPPSPTAVAERALTASSVLARSPVTPAAHTAALDLLSEVSTALTVLMNRCRDLETTLEATRSQARTDLAAAADALRDSMRTSEALKEQLARATQLASDLSGRLATSEQQAATSQVLADRSQQAASEAECLNALFEEKVMGSFGVGSVGHAILQDLRERRGLVPAG